jgi:hypothetical protein
VLRRVICSARADGSEAASARQGVSPRPRAALALFPLRLALDLVLEQLDRDGPQALQRDGIHGTGQSVAISPSCFVRRGLGGMPSQ